MGSPQMGVQVPYHLVLISSALDGGSNPLLSLFRFKSQTGIRTLAWLPPQSVRG